MNRTTNAVRASAALILFAVAGGSASAGNSPVQVRVGEPDHKTIVQNLFAATFTGTPSTGFASSASARGGGITLTRMSDFGLGEIMDATGGNAGSADDKVWKNGIVSASVHARFAGYNQKFGYFPGQSAGQPYVPLFDVGGNGYSVTGGVSDLNFCDLADGWRWGRAGDGSTFSSRPSDNPDGKDHMVTYKIEGLNNGFDASWLLFFEDLRNDQSSDWDYNDLVVQVDVRACTPVVAPLPSAGAMGLAGLAAVAFRRRRA